MTQPEEELLDSIVVNLSWRGRSVAYFNNIKYHIFTISHFVLIQIWANICHKNDCVDLIGTGPFSNLYKILAAGRERVGLGWGIPTTERKGYFLQIIRVFYPFFHERDDPLYLSAGRKKWKKLRS